MKPSNNWGKRGRAKFTRLSLIKRHIRSAQTRSRKAGVKVTLPKVKCLEKEP